MLEEKKAALMERLRAWAGEDLCIAFSGGVDSALLLYMAATAARERGAGARVWAVTFQTELHPQADLEIARQVAAQAGARHTELCINEFENEAILENPPDRCYLCKRMLFARLRAFAQEKGIQTVLDGTNHDDLSAYRPGLRALGELGIVSPLADAGLCKEEVRRLAREYGVPVAERPSAPCMATRLPYGTRLDRETLRRIDRGEEYLRALGFQNVRLRLHGETARIEADAGALGRMVEKREEICRTLKALGFWYITLDLEGFRSGSMDERLTCQEKILDKAKGLRYDAKGDEIQ